MELDDDHCVLFQELEEARAARRAAHEARRAQKQETDKLRFYQAGRLRQLELEKESFRSQAEGDKEALKQEKEELKAEIDQVSTVCFLKTWFGKT